MLNTEADAVEIFDHLIEDTGISPESLEPGAIATLTVEGVRALAAEPHTVSKMIIRRQEHAIARGREDRHGFLPTEVLRQREQAAADRIRLLDEVWALLSPAKLALSERGRALGLLLEYE